MPPQIGISNSIAAGPDCLRDQNRRNECRKGTTPVERTSGWIKRHLYSREAIFRDGVGCDLSWLHRKSITGRFRQEHSFPGRLSRASFLTELSGPASLWRPSNSPRVEVQPSPGTSGMQARARESQGSGIFSFRELYRK